MEYQTRGRGLGSAGTGVLIQSISNSCVYRVPGPWDVLDHRHTGPEMLSPEQHLEGEDDGLVIIYSDVGAEPQAKSICSVVKCV